MCVCLFMSSPTEICSNFRPNLWRPNTCSNCYRPKGSHLLGDQFPFSSVGSPAETQQALHTAVDKAVAARSHRQPPRAFKLRDNINNVIDAGNVLASSRDPEPTLPHHNSARPKERAPQSRVTGAARRSVKPYAVVAIPGQEEERSANANGATTSDTDSSSDRNGSGMETTTIGRGKSRIATLFSRRKAHSKIKKEEKDSRKDSSQPSALDQSDLSVCIPSYDSEPVPALRRRIRAATVTGSAVSRTKASLVNAVVGSESNGGSSSGRRKVPPLKPPRTSSTFLPPCALPEEDDAPQSRQEPGCMQDGGSEAADGAMQTPAGEPSASPSPSDQLQSSLEQLADDALLTVWQERLGCVLEQEDLWGLAWPGDFTVCSDVLAVHKSVPLTIEECRADEPGVASEIEVCKALLPHPNLSLLRSVFSPSSAQKGHWLVLRDCIDLGPLAPLLLPHRAAMTPDAYCSLVLLCLVQVLSGVSALHSRGICHRDVGMETLHACSYGREWMVRLSNFQYALQRDSSAPATQAFVYSYQELRWLGGLDARLPPEIMDTPDSAQTLNYKGTDSFAVGCLMYEMFGRENPFESKPGMVYQCYEEGLPPLPLPQATPPCSPAVQSLCCQLLRRDVEERLSPPTALLVAQAISWLPKDWLTKGQQRPSEQQLEHFFRYQKVKALAQVAKSKGQVSLPLLLEMDFLLHSGPKELHIALSFVL